VIAALKERKDQRWVLYAEISAEALSSLLEGIRSDYGGKGFIINNQGKPQAEEPRGSVANGASWLELGGSNRTGREEVKVVESCDEAGVNNFCLVAGLKRGEWLLCYVHSSQEAYTAMYDARRFSIATLVISVMGIVAVSVVLSTRMIKHIAKADHDKRSMNEQLIEAGKLASLGEMAAGIAHEINNPVGIMVQEAGWMQDLVDDFEQDPDTPLSMEDFKRSLTRIQTQGRRCKEITHQLLSFARKTDHTRREAQINELIEEVVALSAGRARHSNVRIEKKMQDDLPTITISPSEIQQVLLNMINNSLDAFDSKGGIIEIGTTLYDKYVVIEISDNGPGIAKENLIKVFEPFFTTKPVGKGTGLGLSICYGIVKNMGGEVTVSSDTGKGTKFQIILPRGEKKGA
jgi:two-component system, NtrC family, sensor kinase